MTYFGVVMSFTTNLPFLLYSWRVYCNGWTDPYIIEDSFFNFPLTLWILSNKSSFINISNSTWIQWESFSHQSRIWCNCWWNASNLTNGKDLRFSVSNPVLKPEVFLNVCCSPRSKTHLFFLLLYFQLPAHFSNKTT